LTKQLITLPIENSVKISFQYRYYAINIYPEPVEGTNPEQQTKNKEQRTKNKKQRIKNKEQGTTNPEQRTKNNEPQTKNKKPQTKNKEQGIIKRIKCYYKKQNNTIFAY
jgi:hypothetical protein